MTTPDETDRVARRWGDSAFTHQLSQIDWMASPAILLYLNERATGDPARDWLSGWARRYFAGTNLRVLVIGCGEGWLERAIAAWPEVAEVEAVDVAPTAVDRAREASHRLGLTKIRYRVADLNREDVRASAYDVIVAHSILHHVSNLERLLAQIDRGLRSEGVFLVNEYVGPNRFQFNDEVMEAMNELFVSFPPRLRASHLEQRTYERKERPDLETVVANDPSEAVRSEELQELIHAQFDVFEERSLGGTLLQHLFYDVVQNFQFENPAERAMIELCCEAEATLVDGGAIRSHFAILAARRRGAKPIKPRRIPAPALTDDLFDDDPLGWGGGVADSRPGLSIEDRTTGAFLHRGRMLRVLRIALLSTRKQRRMLVRRSRSRELLEQFRYAASRNVSVFEWIRSRHAKLMDATSEDHLSVARLLDAFERLAQRVR